MLKRKRTKLDDDQVVRKTKNNDEVVVVKKSGTIAGYIREKKWPKRTFQGILATCFLLVGFWIGVSEFDWLSGAVDINTASEDVIISMSEDLTEQLVNNAISHQNAGYVNMEMTLTTMRETAAQRQKYIERLMRENPDEFLRIALASDVQSELLHNVEGIEKPVTLTGTLEVLQAVGHKSDSHEHEHNDSEDIDCEEQLVLNLDSGETKFVYLPTSVPVEFYPNDKIKLSGFELGDAVVPNTIADTNNFVVLAAATEQPTGTKHQTAVIVVNINDAVPAANFTKENALKTLENTDNWYREASYGKVHLSGKVDATKSADVYGVYNIKVATNSCPSSEIQTQARSAATKDGFNATGYRHVVVIMNDTISSGKYSTTCSWAGLGSVGGNQSWQFGITSAWVTIHELGHNISLAHASRNYNCQLNGASVVFGGTCTSSEYGDMYDAMGNSTSRGTPMPHFSGVNKSKLGWIPAINVNTVTTSGTYDLYPSEELSNGTQVIRIPQTYGTNGAVTSYYWLEMRKPVGVQGGVSANTKVDFNGVLLRTASATTYSKSYFYQLGSLPGALERCPLPTTTTPTEATDRTYCPSGLRPGMTFTDPANPTLSIKVVSWTPDKATVLINTNSTPPPPPVCTRNNPTITINPTSGRVTPGGKIDYAFTVKSNDSSGCANASYTVTPSSTTSGFSFSPTSRAVSLAPGSTSTSQTFAATSSTNMADGTYSISFRVTHSGDTTKTATQTVSFTVARSTPTPVCTRNNPTITVNPTSGRVAPGGKIDYAVTVKSNDSSDCASTSYTVTPSSNTAFTFSPASRSWTLNPGATGAAQTFSTTSPSNIADGTYSISFRVTNSANNTTVTQNVSFTVVTAAPICTRNNPTVTVNPTSGKAEPGGKVDYTVTVKNNDSASCANANFTVSTKMSNNSTKGFSFSPASKALSLSPGASDSQVFTVTTPDVKDGLHTVVFSTTHSADSKKSDTKNIGLVIANTNSNPNPTPTTPLTISFSGIKDGETIKANGNTKITVNASHSAGIAKIVIYINNNLTTTCNNPNKGTCDVSVKGQNVVSGNHIIRAEVTVKDSAQTTGTASVSFKK